MIVPSLPWEDMVALVVVTAEAMDKELDGDLRAVEKKSRVDLPKTITKTLTYVYWFSINIGKENTTGLQVEPPSFFPPGVEQKSSTLPWHHREVVQL